MAWTKDWEIRDKLLITGSLILGIGFGLIISDSARTESLKNIWWLLIITGIILQIISTRIKDGSNSKNKN